ncbi:hypothetical protein [Azospirillum sp. TSO5]|uniref:hypothetical protein n=1 Tax=Azospirillum sp. TSO5 TaxID=716760 RepID=UPI000D61E35A|nr:hypothetical protein [Azospirillum sp. TSO5]PWC98033.1 hypothetical protein TSO5_03240 [Azospirillum sp. TSO5]
MAIYGENAKRNAEAARQLIVHLQEVQRLIDLMRDKTGITKPFDEAFGKLDNDLLSVADGMIAALRHGIDRTNAMYGK